MQISREQMNTILNNAPKGVDKQKLMEMYIEKGYQIEGIDSNQAIQYIKQKKSGLLPSEKPSVTEEVTPTPEEEPSYLQRVGEQYKNIGERTTKALEKTGAGYLEKAQSGDIAGATGELMRSGLRTVGAVTEGAFAPITEAPIIKQALDFIGEKIGNTEVGQKLAQKIQENPEKAQDIMDIVNTLTLGVGKAVEKPIQVGVEKGLAKTGEAIKTGVETLKTNRAVKLSSQVDDLVGKIVQGTEKDLSRAKKALSDIDTTDIKSYKDLSDVLNEKVSTLSTKLDERLAQSPIYENKLQLGDVSKDIKVGDKIVQHNFVDDALNQLEDYFAKTNNIAEREGIRQLRSKFEKEGITVKDINDLARKHGEKLNAYNASGELASGLTKQAVENTRSGLKSTARDIFGDTAYKEIDSELSNVIRTKDLVDNVANKVTQLQQKITKRGFGEKVGRLVFQVADKFTGGGLKGFVQSFVPRGEGLKIMNALDLEKNLSKNLQLLDKAMNAKTESATIKALEDVIKYTEDYIKNPKMGLGIEDVSKKGKGVIPETNLISEAKKYKSAEEFIKAKQKDIVYHGSNTPLKNFDKRGAFFADDMMNAEGYGENVYEGFLDLKNPLVIDAKGRHYANLKTPYGKTTQEVVSNVDHKKYDGVIFKNINDSFADDVDIVGTDTISYPFNAKKSFINESQLTDIWNKANK